MSAFRFFAYTDFEYHANQTQKYLSLPITLARPTKHTTTDDISHELNILYTVFEILVAIFAIVGNLMVIIVFQRERKLRRRTNYYIVSLAMADFLVGSLGVPFAIMASIGLPTNLYACLFTVSLLVVLCTISIFCLLAVSVDRYWAILYPMAYSRTVRTRTAIGIISMCWLAGALVGFMPLFGWHADVGPNQACLFVEVMDYDYLVFLYFATIITPALLMLAFYAHIYRVIVKQVRQIVLMNPLADGSRRSSTATIQTNINTPSRSLHGGTMLRVLGAARKRDVKATQNLSIIVLFFMVCWIPLYTINCIQAFCRDCHIHPKLTLFCIILSHLNSAVNPVLYAYHLKDFRAALKNLILKVIGVEVEQPIDTIHRFSVASQRRFQSNDASLRTSTQPRIYIDSPVWLRQQQQQALNLKNVQLTPKCGVVTPCLNSLNQSVVAVASVTSNIDSEVWSIVEKTTAPNEKTTVTFEMDKKQQNVSPIYCNNSISKNSGNYDYSHNNYSNSPEDANFDEVFLPMKSQRYQNDFTNEAMNSDGIEYEKEMRRSDSTTNSDYELPKHYVPSTTDAEELRPLKKLFSNSQSSNSSSSLVNSAIFIVDNSTQSVPFSPGHKSKHKITHAYLTKAVTKPISRSCSCTSDPATPNHRDLPNRTKRTLHEFLVAGNKADYHVKSSFSPPDAKTQLSNNINYYTIPYPQQEKRTSPTEKFSPFKAMSQLLFPPVAKHSSLFHIFQPTTGCENISSSPKQKQTTHNSQRSPEKPMSDFSIDDDSKEFSKTS